MARGRAGDTERSRHPAARLGLVAALLVVLSPEVASPQRGSTIEVGDVSAPAPNAGPAAIRELRRALEGAALTMGRGRQSRGALVLAGAVTRLEQERRGGRLRVRCEISVVVSEARGGQVRALLTGRAMTEGGLPRTAAELDGLERGVVSSAAQSALQRLESVIGTI